jgi:hypothetical protein
MKRIKIRTLVPIHEMTAGKTVLKPGEYEAEPLSGGALLVREGEACYSPKPGEMLLLDAPDVFLGLWKAAVLLVKANAVYGAALKKYNAAVMKQ